MGDNRPALEPGVRFVDLNKASYEELMELAAASAASPFGEMLDFNPGVLPSRLGYMTGVSYRLSILFSHLHMSHCFHHISHHSVRKGRAMLDIGHKVLQPPCCTTLWSQGLLHWCIMPDMPHISQQCSQCLGLHAGQQPKRQKVVTSVLDLPRAQQLMAKYLDGSLDGPPWEFMGVNKAPVIGGNLNFIYQSFISSRRRRCIACLHNALRGKLPVAQRLQTSA